VKAATNGSEPAAADGTPAPWAERAAERSPLLQERRSRNMRQIQSMVDAAKRLIGRNGSGFTTQELAREAGVAQQTFYRYFEGKDQLLLAMMEDLHATSAGDFEEAARDLPDSLARLRRYIETMLANLDAANPSMRAAQYITAEHWRLHQLYPQEMALVGQPMVELFARQLRAAREQGMITSSDADRDAEMMVMLVRAVYHHYAYQERIEPTSAIAGRVWEMCLHGIGGPAA
jgi:AcrR family transcriptional regulator